MSEREDDSGDFLPGSGKLPETLSVLATYLFWSIFGSRIALASYLFLSVCGLVLSFIGLKTASWGLTMMAVGYIGGRFTAAPEVLTADE